MKKFILGFILGILFAGLIGVIVAFAAIRLGSSRAPTVAAGSTLVLHLEGSLQEQAPVDVQIPLVQEQQPMTMIETWQLGASWVAPCQCQRLAGIMITSPAESTYFSVSVATMDRPVCTSSV